MDIEHGEALVTGKSLGDRVGFVRFQRGDLSVINLSDQTTAWFADATEGFDGIRHSEPRR